MGDRTTAENLGKQTVDILAAMEDFTGKAAIKCHATQLQGEKRRMRYLKRKATNVKDCLTHSMYDLYDPGIVLPYVTKETNLSIMTDPKSCMNKIIETLWVVHDQIHEIANNMVAAKLKGLSEPLYDYCNCLLSIISEMRRNYRSYEASGWDHHHISRHQESDCNIHDEYESKEESQGYSDHKEA